MHWNYRLVRYRKYPDSIGLHEVYYNAAGEACGMTKDPCTFGSDWKTEDGRETPQSDIIKALTRALSAAIYEAILDEPETWAKFDHEMEESGDE